ILEQRRDRVVDYWFRRVAPLDRFRFTSQGLTFNDLAIDKNLDNAADVKYEVISDGVRTNAMSQRDSETAIPITVSDSPLKVQIRRFSPNWRHLEVDVIVRLVEGKPTVVGIQR